MQLRFVVAEDGLQPGVLTLAIEIANPSSAPDGRGASVGLGFVVAGRPDGCRVLGEESVRPVERDRDDLVPAIERLMVRCGRTVRDLERVAVSVGPGGFTATRVACATGAMLAEGLGVDAYAVPSALAGVMSDGPARPTRFAVLMAAKGDLVWCAEIDFAKGGAGVYEAARGGRMTDLAGLLSLNVGVVYADGHLPESFRGDLEAAGCRVRAVVYSGGACLMAATLCPEVGPSDVVPIYPREPEAVTLWRQRHGDSRGGA